MASNISISSDIITFICRSTGVMGLMSTTKWYKFFLKASQWLLKWPVLTILRLVYKTAPLRSSMRHTVDYTVYVSWVCFSRSSDPSADTQSKGIKKEKCIWYAYHRLANGRRLGIKVIVLPIVCWTDLESSRQREVNPKSKQNEFCYIVKSCNSETGEAIPYRLHWEI